jgi:hypothetical protein
MALKRYYPVYFNFLRTLGLFPCSFNAQTNELVHEPHGIRYTLHIFNNIFISLMTVKQVAVFIYNTLTSTDEPRIRDIVFKIQLLWCLGVSAISITFVAQSIFMKRWILFINSWVRITSDISGKSSQRLAQHIYPFEVWFKASHFKPIIVSPIS